MKKFLLVFIIVIAFVLRFYRLGEVPPSPDWDEAALAYNAYSLFTTGRDEYGEFLPIILRSFDDYKPALFAYLAIPSIMIFGLTTFAIRLPSAIIGVLTVLAAYFIIRELLNNSKEKLNTVTEVYLPFLTGFLLAISPWHIQFSRIAFESNVGLGFNIFAILFFLKGLKKPIFLTISAMFLGLSLYVYQSEKVFVPLLGIVLCKIYFKRLLSIPKKYLFLAFLISVILALPMAFLTLTDKKALTRAQGVSIFTQETAFVKEYATRLIHDKESNNYIGLIFDNRRIVYAKTALQNYLSHYNFYWLFISGDIERHHAPEMGLLYIWELPFLLVGIYALLFGKFDKKTKLLIFSWFLIAPIPAAVTTGVPHAVRSLNFLPTFQIFTALGILTFVLSISKIKLQIVKIPIKYILFSFAFFFLIFNFFYYTNQYFVQMNLFYSEAWQYGYKQAIDEIKKIDSKYKKIIVSNKPHLDQSYIFFLFYYSYSPQTYHKEAKNTSGGFKENHAFGKFEFRPIDWETEEKSSDVLYVGRAEDFPEQINNIKTISFLNGIPAIKIVEGH